MGHLKSLFIVRVAPSKSNLLTLFTVGTGATCGHEPTVPTGPTVQKGIHELLGTDGGTERMGINLETIITRFSAKVA